MGELPPPASPSKTVERKTEAGRPAQEMMDSKPQAEHQHLTTPEQGGDIQRRRTKERTQMHTNKVEPKEVEKREQTSKSAL